MKLTKRQREQVVELLRCARDCSKSISRLGQEQDLHSDITRAAIAARANTSMQMNDAGLYAPDYYDQCLEAAQRVDEGSWP